MLQTWEVLVIDGSGRNFRHGCGFSSPSDREICSHLGLHVHLSHVDLNWTLSALVRICHLCCHGAAPFHHGLPHLWQHTDDAPDPQYVNPDSQLIYSECYLSLLNLNRNISENWGDNDLSLCLLQWIQWPLFCSLHGGLRCFHVWHTWSETSGWTVSSQPPTQALAPTASIGRTAVWWAAPSPTPSLTCPQRTVGGATSAWWLQICAASPGPRLPMRGPSPTPAGFTRAPTLRRTAWPSITVRTLFCPSNTSKNHLNTHFAFIAGLLPICSAISVMAKSAPWLISLLMSLPVAMGLLCPWKRTATLMEHRFDWTVSQGLLFGSDDLIFCQVILPRSKPKKKRKILIYKYDTYVSNHFSRKKKLYADFLMLLFLKRKDFYCTIFPLWTRHFHVVIKRGNIFNNNTTSHLSYTQNVFWVIKW